MNIRAQVLYMHTHRSVPNHVESNRNQVVFTMHRLIWNQTELPLVTNQFIWNRMELRSVPNHLENGKYNRAFGLMQQDSEKIPLCVIHRCTCALGVRYTGVSNDTGYYLLTYKYWNRRTKIAGII